MASSAVALLAHAQTRKQFQYGREGGRKGGEEGRREERSQSFPLATL